MKRTAKLVARLSRGPSPTADFPPDHHLRKRAGGVWWTTLTVYRGGKRHRLSRSLGTTVAAVARDRRDDLIDVICAEDGAYVVLRPRGRS
jgi:hypothetical protein